MTDHEQGRQFDYERTTSPMQSFGTRVVAVGALVALLGLLVVFGLPALLV